jgi:hypothetical protein
MRAALGLVGLILVLAVGYWIYSAQIGPVAESGSQMTQLDAVSVRADLLSLAQSERLYLASNGTYATMEELQQAGNLTIGKGRRGYRYEVTPDGARHFRITAVPSDSSNRNQPTLTIDETMQIR